MSQSQWAIEASNVTVIYRSPKYKFTTFKEYLMNSLKGKGGYSENRALNNVSIKVAKGEAVALIGHNGSGKSTLLRVLAGIIESETAQVKTVGRIAPMIELGAGFDPELTGRENIYLSCTLLGLTNEEITNKIPEIIAFAELEESIDFPFKNFSSGMQARLGFACATAVDPDIILADEVLAVGDSNFSRKCLIKIDELRQKGSSLILVSHDAGAVIRFCSRAYVFDNGNQIFEGAAENALKVHEDVMEARYLKSLKLAYTNASQSTTGSLQPIQGPENLPMIEDLVAAMYQSGVKAYKIYTNLAFQIRFSLTLKKIKCLEGDLTIGFALIRNNGSRLFGGNNKHFNKLIKVDREKTEQKLTVNFEFPQGFPELASGSYHLVFGAHDMNLTRTIFCDMMKAQIFENPLDPINPDQDSFYFVNKSILNITVD